MSLLDSGALLVLEYWIHYGNTHHNSNHRRFSMQNLLIDHSIMALEDLRVWRPFEEERGRWGLKEELSTYIVFSLIPYYVSYPQ